MSKRISLVALLVCCCGAPAPAQVKSPPPPPTYDVELRYEIDALPTQRAFQFREMLKHLKEVGFERDPKDAQRGQDFEEITNRAMDRMTGTIPAANVRKLASDPRIHTVQVKPKGLDLPVPDQPVRAELYLPPTLGGSQRQQVYQNLIQALATIGFRPGVGFDHQNHTRLIGQLPVKSVPAIFNDIRLSPGSWRQLPLSVLDEMRKLPTGQRFLLSLLDLWKNIKGGAKLISDSVDEWLKEPAAQELVRRLPEEVLKLPDVVDEQLLEQMARHPLGTRYLGALLSKVYAAPEGPELMKPLFKRLRTRRLQPILPVLFRGTSPIRIVELRPDWPLPQPLPPPDNVPAEELKLTPDVRQILKDNVAVGKDRRFEVILSFTPPERNRLWLAPLLRAVPTIIVEGNVGPVVAVICKPRETPMLAAIPTVSTVRLPVAARPSVITLPEARGNTAAVLQATGAAQLHAKGARGKGARVGIIADNFQGWEKLLGSDLPLKTRLIDLTAERNTSLIPDPYPGPADQLGNGTQLARAVRMAAPEAEITLIRVDAAAPHLFFVALRHMDEKPLVSEALRERGEELTYDRSTLRRRQDALNKERREVLSLFADDLPSSDIFEKERQKRREDYFKKQAQFEVDQRSYQERVKRYLAYRRALQQLEDIDVVACGLSWGSGHPVNGSSGLTRYFDGTPVQSIMWFQATGTTEGQCWTGLYHDTDQDGTMELSGPKVPLPKGSWNREHGFLAWKPFGGSAVPDLPANLKVRITLQWEESHDPRYSEEGEDPYRQPLNRFNLFVLNQLDPEGKKQPSDDLQVVAQSAGYPQRLKNRKTSAVYEQIVEFTTKAAGRYAIRLDGDIHDGAAPRSAPTLPFERIKNEVSPRLMVEVFSNAGQVVLRSYGTKNGDLTTPGEALQVISVGALNGNGKPQPYTATGAPYGLALRPKPNLFFYDRLGLTGAESLGGSALSTAFAAGYAAALIGKGQKLDQVYQTLHGISKKLSKKQLKVKDGPELDFLPDFGP